MTEAFEMLEALRDCGIIRFQAGVEQAVDDQAGDAGLSRTGPATVIRLAGFQKIDCLLSHRLDGVGVRGLRVFGPHGGRRNPQCDRQ